MFIYQVLTNDKALADITNQLYAADVNGAGDLLVLNLQNRTTSGKVKVDKAPLPLSYLSHPADIS